MTLIFFVLILVLSTMAAATQTETLTRYTYTQYHMGVDARLIVYAKDQTTAETAGAAAFARIAELDTIMSDYRRDSELNKLCAKSGGPPMRVSEDLFIVLERSRDFSKLTNGAFDVTCGPVVRLWRQARKDNKLPDPALMKKALAATGWKKMTLDRIGRRVRLAVPGMQLDLGGIAKGYACDEAQKILLAHGIKSALVEMGGDIVVTGAPPGTVGWTILVPNAVAGDHPASQHQMLKNCAISTSGDTEQFVVIDGVRYSHVVDPRTGKALTNRVQATVIAKDGFTSDPLSKMFALATPRDMARVFRRYPVKASFVKRATD